MWHVDTASMLLTYNIVILYHIQWFTIIIIQYSGAIRDVVSVLIILCNNSNITVKNYNNSNEVTQHREA
jgi:hypothetical protein